MFSMITYSTLLQCLTLTIEQQAAWAAKEQIVSTCEVQRLRLQMCVTAIAPSFYSDGVTLVLDFPRQLPMPNQTCARQCPLEQKAGACAATQTSKRWMSWLFTNDLLKSVMSAKKHLHALIHA